MKRILLALVFVACAKSDRAIDPIWGKQACDGCGMLVENKRTAAEVMTTDGERRFFDDPGCMVGWLDAHAGKDAHAWVIDADRGTWIDAKSAHWKSGAQTPMDYGWEATSNGGETFETMHASVRARTER